MKSCGGQRIGRNFFNPQIIDRLIDQLIGIGYEFRHRWESAETPLGLKDGLAERVDRRDIEKIRVAECLLDAFTIVGEVEVIVRPQKMNARGLDGLIGSRIRIELLQDFACAFSKFACGVVCEGDKQDFANARDGSVQNHSGNQMANRVSFSCSSTGFDDGKPAVDV